MIKHILQKLNYGEKRTTGDLEGEIIEKSDKKIKDIKKVEKRLNSFLGEQFQIPPKFSAIKIDGKKLYEYARAGENIKIPERKITIYNIKLLNFDIENQIIKFEVNCSKGTYIRTLCEDIAEKLETCGYMKELKRTRIDNFKIENSISLEELEQNKDNEEFLKNNVISIEKVFENKNKMNLNKRKTELFLNGVKLTYNLEDDIYLVYSNNKFIGLGKVKDNLLKRDVIENE